jgi:hypothetical protein
MVEQPAAIGVSPDSLEDSQRGKYVLAVVLMV